MLGHFTPRHLFSVKLRRDGLQKWFGKSGMEIERLSIIKTKVLPLTCAEKEKWSTQIKIRYEIDSGLHQGSFLMVVFFIFSDCPRMVHNEIS